MKIALDTHVSKHIARILRENHGYKIVYHANDEHDQLWLSRALDKGAEVFVSMDWDIDIFCNRLNLKCILLKGDIKRDKILPLLVAELKKYSGEYAKSKLQSRSV